VDVPIERSNRLQPVQNLAPPAPQTQPVDKKKRHELFYKAHGAFFHLPKVHFEFGREAVNLLPPALQNATRIILSLFSSLPQHTS
jgi:hypothetical protein